jgi:hypothetical protein
MMSLMRGATFWSIGIGQRGLECVRVGQFPEINDRIQSAYQVAVAAEQLHATLGKYWGKLVQHGNEILELPRLEFDRWLQID